MLYNPLRCYTMLSVFRKILNPRIVLLDCPLEYKKGESQVRACTSLYMKCACLYNMLLLKQHNVSLLD